MKPRIGINCDIETVAGPPPRRKATVPIEYIDYVRAAGGVPCVIPPGDDVEVSAWLADIDGMLFIGGDDYRLANGAEEPADFLAVDEQRERNDIALARSALERDLPVFGICGGFQLLVLVAGGTLHGDLPSEAPSPITHKRAREGDPIVRHDIEWHGAHDGIEIVAGCHDVNSHHHQGVSAVPSSWRVLARSDDELVEAAVGPGVFQLGVQWHPEKDPEAPVSRSLARALVESASRRRGASR